MSSPDDGDGGRRGLRIPKVAGHELIRVIGHGSYGEVWLARTVLGAYRAVKIVYRLRSEEDRPFLREFEGIRRFEPISREHPGLVDILQVGRGEREGWFYYVMELADDAVGAPNGAPIDRAAEHESYKPKTLGTLLHQPGARAGLPSVRKALPPGEALEIARELCSAAGYLHRNGLVHRDIKPSNIIFINGALKLADIGLVTPAREDCTLVGTAGFIPPEGPGAAQADIYSLGKVLYEMLTGFSAREYPRVPDDWSRRADSDLLHEVNRIVLRACQGDPKRRYASAREMATDLDLLISGKSLKIRELQRALLRQRWAIAGFVAAFLLVFALGGFLFFQRRAVTERQRRELREVQIARMRLRGDGWASNCLARLERAAAGGTSPEVREQAPALLAGLDARAVVYLDGTPSRSAAFAPDGRLLVSGTGTNHTFTIEPDGTKTELTAQGEGLVCWDAAGVPLHLSAAADKLVLVDASSGLKRREFAFPEAGTRPAGGGRVFAVAPGAAAVAAQVPDDVLVWSGFTGEVVGRTQASASALAFSPDASLLGAGFADGSSRIYRVPGLEQVAALPPAIRGTPIQCLAFVRSRVVRQDRNSAVDSWLVATGDQGAGIVVWDLGRRAPRCFCRGSTWTVTAVAFSPDGLLLASAGRNQPRLWDTVTGQVLLQLSRSTAGDAMTLAFDRTGKRLATGGRAGSGTGTTTLWELQPHRGIHSLRGLASPVRKIWFSANSSRIAALSDDWHLAVWDVPTDTLLFVFEAPVGISADHAGGCFDTTGERLAFVAGAQGCLFDLQEGTTLHRWSLNPGACDQLQVNATGSLRLLRREQIPEEPKIVWKLYRLEPAKGPVLLHQQKDTKWAAFEMALLPRAERFFVWNGGPTSRPVVVHAYDAESGREIWQGSTEKPKGDDFRLYFDPLGKVAGYTAFTPLPSRLRLVRAQDLAEIGVTAEYYEAISPGGEQFASPGTLFLDRYGEQHSISLSIDWATGSCAPVFSPDGRLLSWGTQDGIVLVVDLPAARKQLARFE